MAIGISTACFYPKTTEESIVAAGELGAECAEIFINSPCELEPRYMDQFDALRRQYDMRIKSFHTYGSFTESYYYFSSYERRFYDSLEDFKRYFYGMGKLGAQLLVLHGAKIPGSIPDDLVFERFDKLYELGAAQGITLCQENVVHYRSESPAFMARMRDALGSHFHMVLDIKQARRAGVDPYVFVDRFADHIAHVHISDYTDERDCVVPLCEGAKFDFQTFFATMKSKGYKGDYMIELYEHSYEDPAQIRFAYETLKKWL